MAQSISSLAKTYCNRFKVKIPFFNAMPSADLSLVIAIPSYKELNLIKTLDSLSKCTPPLGNVEIIIGINAPEGSAPEVILTNKQTVEQIEAWSKKAPDYLTALVIQDDHVSQKIAGAGYARKLVMDEALHRWAALDKDGPIVCLDADCTVSENYLTEIEKVFANPEVRLGHLHFEHLYQSEEDKTLRSGIIDYELHLRCYIHGLKLASYPYAIHTVGSCMAVRASTYSKGGGMNSRKAGEDFHFLHKLVQHGGWHYINTASVYPSCRASDRVPFGTGKAQLDYKKTLTKNTYNPEIYRVLAQLFEVINQWFDHDVNLNLVNKHVREFLVQENIEKQTLQMKMRSSTLDSFLKRWWQWMDGLKVLKLVHYLRDHEYPNVPVVQAAQALLKNDELESKGQPQWLLERFRNLDYKE